MTYALNQLLFSHFATGITSAFGNAQMQAAIQNQQYAAQQAAAAQAYTFQMAQHKAAAASVAPTADAALTIDGECKEIEAASLLMGPPTAGRR